jgi:hypothetical protein
MRNRQISTHPNDGVGPYIEKKVLGWLEHAPTISRNSPHSNGIPHIAASPLRIAKATQMERRPQRRSADAFHMERRFWCNPRNRRCRRGTRVRICRDHRSFAFVSRRVPEYALISVPMQMARLSFVLWSLQRRPLFLRASSLRGSSIMLAKRTCSDGTAFVGSLRNPVSQAQTANPPGRGRANCRLSEPVSAREHASVVRTVGMPRYWLDNSRMCFLPEK